MEIWKDIKGYEGLYQVSNLGKVRSLTRKVSHRKWFVTKKGRELTLISNADGYLQCKLCRDGKSKTVRVHQIVAETFISKPVDGEYEVNHKDNNRQNNHVDNLEWVTHAENIRQAIVSGNHFCTRDINGSNNPNYKNTTLKEKYAKNPQLAAQLLSRPGAKNGRAVECEVYKDGKYIASFSYIGECAEWLISLGYSTGTALSVRDYISRSMKTGKAYKGFNFYKK